MSIARHYAKADIIPKIAAGLQAMGKSIEECTVADLGAADEFHLGGMHSTLRLFQELSLTGHDAVLDVGSGLGGPARVAASHYGCSVRGVDLTEEYVVAATELTSWPSIALGNLCTFETGNALDMPSVRDASVDKAYMLHVGMNIEDKSKLFAEIARTLKPGGVFGCWEIMASSEAAAEQLVFPLPFASSVAECAVATPTRYCSSLEKAGLSLVSKNDFSELVLAKFAESAKASPQPLGLHIVMGSELPVKLKNLAAAFAAGNLEAWQMIWTKPKGSAV